MPRPQDSVNVEKALVEVAKSTVNARHVGPPGEDDALAVLARRAADERKDSVKGSSSSPILIDEEDDDPFPFPPKRLLCQDVTCLETFGSDKEMDEHAKKAHAGERLLIEDTPKDYEKTRARQLYQFKCKKCSFRTFDSYDA